MAQVDVVTVFHNASNQAQAVDLARRLTEVEPTEHRMIFVDNSVENRGFAGGCNFGAELGDSPLVLFLNPDVVVNGPFMEGVLRMFARDASLVICGEKFGKPRDHYWRHWGCPDWVCGAAMFVRRSWWEQVGGFDEAFVWGWEETDLIRRAQGQKRRVHSCALPLTHASPSDDSPEDLAYKAKHMAIGQKLFYQRWGNRSSGGNVRHPSPSRRRAGGRTLR